jgi:hypothetical protein
MPTIALQESQQRSSSCYRGGRHAITTFAFVLAASICGGLAQNTAQVSLIGPSQVRLGGYAQYGANVGGATTPVVWSVNGFPGGTNSTGLISTAGMYSPASTIWAGHSVTISTTTVSEPVSSASMRVMVLNPLPILASGLITQTRSANSYSLVIQGSGFVSTSQLQSAGVNVSTVFISFAELQGTISIPPGTTSVTVGVVNPNAEQKVPASMTLPVQTGTSSASLAALSCSSASITGTGSSACVVTLTTAAGSGGINLSLASSNAAVIVPAAVVVPANATSAVFTANVSSVLSAQVATITASGAGSSRSFALQLNAATPTLTISPSSVPFGNTTMNTPSTQPVILTSTGTAPVIVTSAALSGVGFTMSGATFPVTLNPGLAVTLDVQFDPTVSGAATGDLSIKSNSSVNGTAVVSLSGTGVSHQVALSWDAPAMSTVPILSYNTYRLTSGSSAYQLLHSSAAPQTTYVDSTVQTDVTYNYIVTSIDSTGEESAPSNEVTATIP